jgi:hypothetical protein
MTIYVPAQRKKKKGLTLSQVASRWRVKTAEARYYLEQAGIRIVPIETPPSDGVLMGDLLAYEARMRAEEAVTK